MYTGKHAHLRPLQPAFIMAGSGETVTYAELEARCPLVDGRVIGERKRRRPLDGYARP